jgi:hypothetical protein
MSSVVISGDTSGAITVSAPAVSGTNTLTLQAATATSAVNTLGTVNAGGTNPFPSSGGPTVVDFTSLPSWIKRITVMFSGVSLNSTGAYLIQLGDSGGVETSGYDSATIVGSNGSANTVSASVAGFPVFVNTAASLLNGSMIITNITGNTWVEQGVFNNFVTTPFVTSTAGTKTLSAALDRVRITTTTGTDTFDAGTINILYEG